MVALYILERCKVDPKSLHYVRYGILTTDENVLFVSKDIVIKRQSALINDVLTVSIRAKCHFVHQTKQRVLAFLKVI